MIHKRLDARQIVNEIASPSHWLPELRATMPIYATRSYETCSINLSSQGPWLSRQPR